MRGCCTRDYERLFGARAAARDARRYRKHGLQGSARALVDLAGDVEGASVLEVGGGVGAIELELLAGGAATQPTSSSPVDTRRPPPSSRRVRCDGARRAPRGGLRRRRSGDRSARHRRHASGRLLLSGGRGTRGAAAKHAGRRLLLTYPRNTGSSRRRPGVNRSSVVALDPPGLCASGRTHRRDGGGAGLGLEARKRHGLLWESARFRAVRPGPAEANETAGLTSPGEKLTGRAEAATGGDA